ncbi:hypothetical protein LIER_17368 [Lithospermum erythrorhizon]|uniref:Wound-induced protein 1 n=1 Tax=Lithospermum erythrorhizon TaxID=34254 RepID=A0AAV3QBH0_LITER
MDNNTNHAKTDIFEQENHSHVAIVRDLYRALASGNASQLKGLIASDLECGGSMILTLGNSNEKAFKFEPRSIDLIDECVIVEGWEGEEVYWVHVWSVEDGMITQFREYFNTWLIVKDGKPQHKCLSTCSTLWESNPNDLVKRSLPGLMLAI